jgi:catechol 2,3-dioxygenase-like lactoylglutathione lyase family enzyme
MSKRQITIVEVGPRDGLQSEPEILPTVSKVIFIEKAIDAGVRRLEVASFVHPKLVPQMADAEALIEKLPQRDDVSYIGLIMNERGLDRALTTNIHEIGMVVVASDTYNRKNQGCSTSDSVSAWQEISAKAKSAGLRPNVMISSAFGCPYEGEVKVERVIELAKQLVDAGPAELGIADSIGVAVPDQVSELLGRVKEVIGDVPLRRARSDRKYPDRRSAVHAGSIGRRDRRLAREDYRRESLARRRAWPQRACPVAKSRRISDGPGSLIVAKGFQLSPSSVHHINFVVRDLDEACARFEQALGLEPFERVDHAPRGATVARSRVGESWLVLVAPYDPESVPGRFLEEHGEGFFLLSLAVDELQDSRAGILDWRVKDLGEIQGALFQLTEAKKPDASNH